MIEKKDFHSAPFLQRQSFKSILVPARHKLHGYGDHDLESQHIGERVCECFPLMLAADQGLIFESLIQDETPTREKILLANIFEYI